MYCVCLNPNNLIKRIMAAVKPWLQQLYHMAQAISITHNVVYVLPTEFSVCTFCSILLLAHCSPGTVHVHTLGIVTGRVSS